MNELSLAADVTRIAVCLGVLIVVGALARHLWEAL
jgi:hypothetical protein